MEKKFRMVHNNFNVYDLSKSLQFYEDAFDMKMVKKLQQMITATSSCICLTATVIICWN